MLTPFTSNDEVDFDGLEKLVEWYLDHQASALFAICQSSEMQFLSVKERVEIARFTVDIAHSRGVPVIASGHVANSSAAQIQELLPLAGSGIDGFVLVTNRLDQSNEGFEAFKNNIEILLSKLPPDLPLGLYECPAPFRRLLSDDEIKLCRDTGRFVVLKDVSCDLETIKRRLKIVSGTPFSIINANAAIAYQAMRAGSPGFAGVFTNFHPDLYAWLYQNLSIDSKFKSELVTYLATSACAESMGYPGIAKLYHQKAGTFQSAHSRAIEYNIRDRHWAVDSIIAHIEDGDSHFRNCIKNASSSA